jgi:hypothetical protein
MCSACANNFVLDGGLCSPIVAAVSTVAPQNYSELKLASEYLNDTNLKVTLYAINSQFQQI